MRKMLLSAGITMGLTMAMATMAAPAFASPLAQRLANEANVLERINEARPRGPVYAAIANTLELLRGRIRDLYSGRIAPADALSQIDDALHGIGQYSYNGSDIAPWQHARTAPLVEELRREVQGALVAQTGGYGGGYGRGGYGRGGWHRGSYEAPVQAPPVVTPRYAPVAPVYAPAPVYRQTPPVYVLPPAPARFRY